MKNHKKQPFPNAHLCLKVCNCNQPDGSLCKNLCIKWVSSWYALKIFLFSFLIRFHVFDARVTESIVRTFQLFFVRRILVCMIVNDYQALKEIALNETTTQLLCERCFGTMLQKPSNYIHFLASFLISVT